MEINKNVKSLKNKSKKIKFEDAKAIIHELQRVLSHIGKRGLALCGPQINEHHCVIFINCMGKKVTMVNPVILNYGKEKIKYPEGCLSFPGKFIEITRPDKITVEYIDYKGDEIKDTFTGLISRVIQHEIDHLDGKLIIDHE